MNSVTVRITGEIPALDLDDVVVPAPAMSTTTQPLPVLSSVSSQAGISTTQVASPSTSTNGEPDIIVINQIVPLTNNQLTDEHMCRVFAKHVAARRQMGGLAAHSFLWSIILNDGLKHRC